MMHGVSQANFFHVEGAGQGKAKEGWEEGAWWEEKNLRAQADIGNEERRVWLQLASLSVVISR
jgi:hypothetical protein